MKVTITLGERAEQFVTGIPLEELPDILSSVLERSLEESVEPIPQAPTPDNGAEQILNQLRELLKDVQRAGGDSSKEDSIKKTISFVESSKSVILDDDLGMFNLLK